MEYLFAALLIAALVLLIVVQAVGRHRRLSRREAEADGPTTIPKATWIVFGAAAVFLLFAVFGLPAILHR